MSFVIFKASGGLAHMCRLLSQIIDVSKKYNRYLLIDCETHDAFKNKFSDFFYIDDKTLKYGCDYEVIPKSYTYCGLSVEKIKNFQIKIIGNNQYCLKGTNIILNRFNNGNLNILSNFKDVPYNLNIKVNKNICESLKEKELKEPYISIHFRNTDIKNNIIILINVIKIIITKSKIKTIYLATDDFHAYNILKKNLKNINIIQYTKPENFNGKNIHYRTVNKNTLINNCLLDMYMILNSNIFIPSRNSGLSKWLIYMINKKKNIFDIVSKTKIV